MVEKERARLLARAKEIDLVLGEALIAGVIENRELLEQHRALVARFLAEHPEI
jgi:hypothetical protein